MMPRVAFYRLFRGRTDAVGGDEGRCYHEPVTVTTYVEHLHGVRLIGIYPLLDDNTAWWGCSDIDQGPDVIAPAVNLWKTFNALGIFSYVERSRSKGFHLWVFFSNPVPAEIIRNAFFFVHQIAGVPAKEVNPKAATLDGLKLSNYVRLPYPAMGASGRQVMLDMERADRCPLSLDEFLARVKTNTPSAIEAVAARYVAPRPLRPVVIGECNSELEPLCARMDFHTAKVWREGSVIGADRSTTMVWLAYRLQEEGFTPAETLALLDDWDVRFQKFVGRADRDIQLTKIVERAFG